MSNLPAFPITSPQGLSEIANAGGAALASFTGASALQHVFQAAQAREWTEWLTPAALIFATAAGYAINRKFPALATKSAAPKLRWSPHRPDPGSPFAGFESRIP